MQVTDTPLPSKQKILETLSWLIFGTSCWVCALLFIELTPKDSSHGSSIRLAYTVAYFAVWCGLFLHINRALPLTLQCVYRWRYEDAPLGITKAWKNQIEEISFVFFMCSVHAVVLATTTALHVVRYWLKVPDLIGFLITTAWVAALVLSIVFVIRVPKNFSRIFEHFRFLRRQLAICEFFEPRSFHELWNPLGLKIATKPIFAPKDGFIVGGRTWSYPALTKNAIVFGSIGTGKTVCVMNCLLEQMIISHSQSAPIGGLILDYKGEFLGKLRSLCAKHGRSHDLLVLSAESDVCWNPLDTNESASEVAARFVATMKSLGQKDQQTPFFTDQAETFLEHAIHLLRVTRSDVRRITPMSVHRLANDFAFLDAQVEQLQIRNDHDSPDSSTARCRQYFQAEFFQLPVETRQSVIATLNNMLNPLCNELVTPVMCHGRPISLDAATLGSKLIYLDLPQSKVPRAGRILGVLLKLAYYAQVQRKPLDCRKYSFLFADEFQEFYTSDPEMGDTRFYCLSRQYDHINIVATQNINNLRMRGERAEAVMSFLANVKTKIFLQNSDKDTNEYASQLFGQYVAELGGGHMAGQAQLMANVRPEDFLFLQKPEHGRWNYCEYFVLDESAAKVNIGNRLFHWPVHEIRKENSSQSVTLGR